MDTERNVGGGDRLARTLLAVVLSILAFRWLKQGKRGRGLLAGVGALGFGFNATTGYCGANDALGVDTTASDTDDSTDESVDFDSTDTGASDETTSTTSTATDARLTCSFCGDPIVPGQLRGPNEQGQIVHDDCA